MKNATGYQSFCDGMLWSSLDTSRVDRDTGVALVAAFSLGLVKRCIGSVDKVVDLRPPGGPTGYAETTGNRDIDIPGNRGHLLANSFGY